MGERVDLIANSMKEKQSELEQIRSEKIGKEVIEYIVVSISEFAKRYKLSLKEASNYLVRYKGIDFLAQCYEAEHTLSVGDWVDDVTEVCKQNGGGVELEK